MNQFEHSIFNIRFSTFQTKTMNFEQRTTTRGRAERSEANHEHLTSP
jgi:hypothetical protein